MRPLTKTSAILLFLTVWIAVADMAIGVKRRIEPPRRRITQAAPPAPLRAFAEPTAEELAMMAGEQSTQGLIRLPVTKKLKVFSCPKKTCRILGSLMPGDELVFDISAIDTASEWLPIVWHGAGAASGAAGYVTGTDIENAYQPPPPLPAARAAAFEPGEPSPSSTPAAEVPIDPESIVGIVCQFDSNEGGVHDRRMVRGSGAIITDDGYVVTARSVVDLTYLQDGFEGYKLTKCLVGQLPASTPLPDVESIRTRNAFVRLPYLAYAADIAYIPPEEDLSEYEKAWLDVAVLKINGVNPDAKYFGGPAELPDSFPIAPFLISELPKLNDDTLNFAFPSGTTVGNGADITTLFMQGLISHVTGFWAGDSHYANDLFLIESHLDTEDTAGGRFGSPIFWKGYVVGIHTAKQQGTRQIYNVGSKAILEKMATDQFIIPLSAQ